jgi:hypothetical protein
MQASGCFQLLTRGFRQLRWIGDVESDLRKVYKDGDRSCGQNRMGIYCEGR